MRALALRTAKWAAAWALIVCGCARGNPSPAPDPLSASGGNAVQSSDTDSSFDNLDIVDPRLNGKLAILRVGSEVGANNLLSVFAGLRNKTARRLALEVQTIYKDKDGNAINSGSWISFVLKPHEEKEYRSASISEEAVDFLVRVRRAPPSVGSL